MVDPRVSGCKGKLAGMVGLIFFCGMATGALTMNLADRYWLRPPAPVLTEAEKEFAVQHFSRELELDAQQAKAMEDILDEFIMQQANLMAEFKSSRTSGHDRIIQILNEEQRKRLSKVLSEMSNKRQH